jgi:hypothetical protein
MGGVIEACCLQPIDVIKTRLQLDKAHKYKGLCAAACRSGTRASGGALTRPSAAGLWRQVVCARTVNTPNHQPPMRTCVVCAPLLAPGIVDCGRQVVQQEGTRALWKGLTPFATHLTLKYALRMGSNSVYQVRVRCRPWCGMCVRVGGVRELGAAHAPSACPWVAACVPHSCRVRACTTTTTAPQGVLRDHNGHLSDGRRMAAGFAAGITEALLVVTPFEVVKIRLQQQKGLAYDKLKYHVRAAPATPPRGGGGGGPARGPRLAGAGRAGLE